MADKYRVLIADDEMDIRIIGEAVLRKEGYDIITAEDGQRAWEIYQEQKGELSALLTDILMPKMDGFELMKKVREDDLDFPIVAFTATHKSEAREVGANYVLEKPFDNKDLAEMVGKAVRGEKEE